MVFRPPGERDQDGATIGTRARHELPEVCLLACPEIYGRSSRPRARVQRRVASASRPPMGVCPARTSAESGGGSDKLTKLGPAVRVVASTGGVVQAGGGNAQSALLFLSVMDGNSEVFR